MATILRRLVSSVWRRGPAETVSLVFKNLMHEFHWYIDRRFDRIHGTDTSDRIELDKLDIAGSNREHGVYYEPTSTRLFCHMMEQIGSAISSEDFVFVDYGSGKGRTLMIASDYRFKEIIGVEFSRELHLIAKRNLAIYRGSHQKCGNIRVVHSDASLFDPPTDNLLVYFYNPFLKEVMIKVLERLSAIAHTRGIRIALIYLNPLSNAVVENSGLFCQRLEIHLPKDYSREQQRRCFAYFSWPDAPGTRITSSSVLPIEPATSK